MTRPQDYSYPRIGSDEWNRIELWSGPQLRALQTFPGNTEQRDLPKAGDYHPITTKLIALSPKYVEVYGRGSAWVVHYVEKGPVITPEISRQRWAAYPVS